MKFITTLFVMLFSLSLVAQPESSNSQKFYDIINDVSADRIKKDIEKLVSFGTRHTLSDTVSQTRGIGAARRWIKSEFTQISKGCNECIEVSYIRNIVEGDPKTRIKKTTEIVSVMAVLKGAKYPNRYVIMSGDIDSRVSDVLNSTSDSPGANDNATGMAGVLEAARVLSKYPFESSIIFVGLSGEEQGLYGGKYMAEVAIEEGWEIIGVLNNDMIEILKVLME